MLHEFDGEDISWLSAASCLNVCVYNYW